MLRRQFYYALAVHERRGQLQGIIGSAAAERERLLRAARKGARLHLIASSGPRECTRMHGWGVSEHVRGRRIGMR